MPLAVKFMSWTKSVRQSGTASASIKTAKGADCQIIVTYSSVVSEAKGLVEKTAGSDGTATWKWTVGSNTKPGSWPIEVTCILGSRSGNAQVDFKVTN